MHTYNSSPREQEKTARFGTKHIVFIIGIAAVSMGIRLWLSPSVGHQGDIHFFEVWSSSLTLGGFGSIYARTWCDYPPFPLYIFSAIGLVYKSLWSETFLLDTTLLRVLLKLPSIVADLGCSLAIFFLVIRHTSFSKAVFAMALFAFNPGIIYNSSWWGQADSVMALFLILALYAFYRRSLIAWMFLALAILTKPQGALLAPVLAIAVMRQGEARTMAKGIAILILTFLVLSAPFMYGSGVGLTLSPYTNAVGREPTVTASAHNLWHLLTLGKGGSDATNILQSSITYRHVGLFLFFGAAGIVLARLATDYDWRRILVSSALLYLAFFLLPTEVHERYLFYPLALLCVAQAWNSRLTPVCILLSVTFFANLVMVAPFSDWAQRILQFVTLDGIILAAVNVIVLPLAIALSWRAPKREEEIPLYERGGEPIPILTRRNVFLAAGCSLALVAVAAGLTVGYFGRGFTEVASGLQAMHSVHTVDFRMGESIRLTGYSVTPTVLERNGRVVLSLHWQAEEPIAEEYTVFAHLIYANWEMWGQHDGRPAEGTAPTSSWLKGFPVEDKHVIEVPGNAPSGRYRLEVGMYREGSLARLPVEDSNGETQGTSILLASLKLGPAQPVETTEAFESRTSHYVNLANQVAFLGHTTACCTPESDSECVRVTLYWQYLRKMSADYTVFVHLVDEDNRILAQADGQPLNGLYPTSIWDEDEVVRDDRVLLLPSDLQPSRFRLEIGMYALASGKRLPRMDGLGDQISLPLVISHSQ